MPQYPFPPVPDWFNFEEPVGSGRRIDYRPDAPRFRHLPLVQRRDDETLEVLRGDPDVLEQIAAAHVDRFPTATPGDEYFVARNRLGHVHLMPTGSNWAGKLEPLLYTSRYDGPDRLAAATTFEELHAFLRTEAPELRRLRADGWELIAFAGAQFLIDTQRPDEGPLSSEELPDVHSMVEFR